MFPFYVPVPVHELFSMNLQYRGQFVSNSGREDEGHLPEYFRDSLCHTHIPQQHSHNITRTMGKLFNLLCAKHASLHIRCYTYQALRFCLTGWQVTLITTTHCPLETRSNSCADGFPKAAQVSSLLISRQWDALKRWLLLTDFSLFCCLVGLRLVTLTNQISPQSLYTYHSIGQSPIDGKRGSFQWTYQKCPHQQHSGPQVSLFSTPPLPSIFSLDQRNVRTHLV